MCQGRALRYPGEQGLAGDLGQAPHASQLHSTANAAVSTLLLGACSCLDMTQVAIFHGQSFQQSIKRIKGKDSMEMLVRILGLHVMISLLEKENLAKQPRDMELSSDPIMGKMADSEALLRHRYTS